MHCSGTFASRMTGSRWPPKFPEIPDIAAISGISNQKSPPSMAAAGRKERFSTRFGQHDIRSALAEAKATALPGLPIIITLQSADELAALVASFEVGGEDNPNVSEGHWDSIMALIEQAA
jgi:hypothetical protein